MLRQFASRSPFRANWSDMPCTKCDGFAQRFNIATIREYRDVVRQLMEIVNEGTFLLVYASCPLQEVFQVFQAAMPGDSIHHDFRCFACGRTFHLGADIYHGHASWTVGDVPQQSENLGKPN